MAKPQVRLDPDVADALDRLRGDRSLSHVANAKLRQLLGLPAPGTAHDEQVLPEGANACGPAAGPIPGTGIGAGACAGASPKRSAKFITESPEVAPG